MGREEREGRGMSTEKSSEVFCCGLQRNGPTAGGQVWSEGSSLKVGYIRSM